MLIRVWEFYPDSFVPPARFPLRIRRQRVRQVERIDVRYGRARRIRTSRPGTSRGSARPATHTTTVNNATRAASSAPLDMTARWGRTADERWPISVGFASLHA